MVDNISFLQLNDSFELNEEQLREIACLIYDTDPYIYPALFGKRNNAIRLIPPLIVCKQDSMFRLSNMYVAIIKNQIKGLILWKDGKMQWSPGILCQLAKELHIEISRDIDYVSEMYMDRYNLEERQRSISLINMCVSEDARGLRIGTQLLNSFIKEHTEKDIRLCVLKDNKTAIRMYQTSGFCVVEEFKGFSLNPIKPDCFEMILPYNI